MHTAAVVMNDAWYYQKEYQDVAERVWAMHHDDGHC